MRLLILASAGGALGAGARHLVNLTAGRWIGSTMPWGTFTVNVIGSFLMGVLVVWISRRAAGSLETRVFLATGILGGFTTFSAFSLDFYTLVTRGELTAAFTYAIGSVVLSIAALYCGTAIARGLGA